MIITLYYGLLVNTSSFKNFLVWGGTFEPCRGRATTRVLNLINSMLFANRNQVSKKYMLPIRTPTH